MAQNKRIQFEPISYIGLALALLGFLGPNILQTQYSILRMAGAILFIVGLYLAFKGLKNPGNTE